MIVGMHHVGLCVPDLDKAIGFYCGVLGMQDLWGGEANGDDDVMDRVIGLKKIKVRMRMIRAGASFIELWEYHNPVPKPIEPDYPPSDRGFTHIGLQVTDIEAEYQRLIAAGMTFVGPVVHLGPQSAVYGRDPFGNIVEIYEIFDPALPGLEVPATA